MKISDIDLDTGTRFDPLELFPWTRASIVKDEELVPHPCGIYPQRIPIDQLTRLAAIPYQEAEKLGYRKLDFLHVQIYDNFESREEIDLLLELEPDWNLLTQPAVQRRLFQLSNHGDVLSAVKPRSVEELADVLALIRPGKKQLVRLYNSNRSAARQILYAKDENGYQFKRAHSFAYALVVILNLHLIALGVL